MQGKRRKLCIGDDYPLQFDANGTRSESSVTQCNFSSSDSVSMHAQVYPCTGQLASFHLYSASNVVFFYIR